LTFFTKLRTGGLVNNTEEGFISLTAANKPITRAPLSPGDEREKVSLVSGEKASKKKGGKG